MHYNKQLCTVWYTTASAGIARGGGLLTSVQHKCYDENTSLASQRLKVRLSFSLRRVGGTEGGAGSVRAAVVTEGAGTCGAAAAASVRPLQHAGLEI